MRIKTSKTPTLLILIVLSVLLLAGLGHEADAKLQTNDSDDPLFINLWPDGIVPYRFDDGRLGPVTVHPDDRTKVEKQMARWEKALTITDPSGNTKQYIDFRPCGSNCSGSYLVIRYNWLNSDGTEAECNNMSEPVGLEFRQADACNGITDPVELERCRRKTDGITELNLSRTNGECPGPNVRARTTQDNNTILHELGHALGLWHEFNRGDADAYLVEQLQQVDCDRDGFNEGDDADGDKFITCFHTRSTQLIPVLGNYDYDSVMAYKGNQDLLANPFSRQSAQTKTDAPANRDASGNYLTDYSISSEIKSRLLQYYAHGYQPNWGFFRPLSAPPPPVVGSTDTDWLFRRNPYLAPGVAPVGTPAIALQSTSNYDIFVRGSDEHLYWKAVRNDLASAQWENLGCCFGSDPAAISLGGGQIDLFAVDVSSGKLKHKRYQNGQWSAPITVQGGFPSGGIKWAAGGYLGPAVTSRGSTSLDVFVVRSDGRLSVVTLSGGQWTGWTSLGQNYNVTARPAAVALSATRVQLAINENNVNLYEPVLTFPPDTPSFSLGALRGRSAHQSAPALAKRNDSINPYRVLVVNADGRLSHRFANGSWRDIGGLPKPGTGPSAVALGSTGAFIVMNGTHLVGCNATCDDPSDSNANGTFIEPGGVWLRQFK